MFERRRLRVYVAGPISQGDVFENVVAAVRVGKRLVRDGIAPYVPHLDAYMVLGGTDISWNAFLEWDLEWVAQSEAVFRIAGPSEGADLEVQHAIELDIPVFYEDDDGYTKLLNYAAMRRLTGVRR